MYPEITIKISMRPEGVTISGQPITTVMGEAPEPPSLEELEAIAGMEMGEAPGPPSLEELEAIAGMEVGEAPEPPSLKELEATAEEESGVPKGGRKR